MTATLTVAVPVPAPMPTRPTVVMSGPLPPAVGGMASVLAALGASTLPGRVDLRLFETGKTTPAGRPWWQGVGARLRLMADWWGQLGRGSDQPAPVAHIHTCSGFTFFLDGLLASLARSQGCRVVLHIHGGLFDQFLDSLNPFMRAVARRIARRADLLLALSDDWRQRLTVRLPGSRIAVLANGVAEPLGDATQRTNNEEPTFVFLGLLSTLKGVPMLLDALSVSKARWRVQLAGNEGEAGFADRLRATIAQRGLTDRMPLLGPVVGTAKERLLLQADGFVLPSLAEGLPMSLLEAMAARLPVVVTSVGAMPEVIEDGVDGLLVPPSDVAALARALDQLAQSATQRVAMGQAGYAKYRARYSVDAMAQGLLGLYQTALDTGQR
jgi:glycosyltransferase involved in cell wall biosynthesis